MAEAPLRRWVLLLLAAVPLAFAPAPLPKAPRRATAPTPSMEGTWRMGHQVVRITARDWTFDPNGGGRPVYAAIADRTVNPPTFDLSPAGGGPAEWMGIYRLDG